MQLIHTIDVIHSRLPNFNAEYGYEYLQYTRIEEPTIFNFFRYLTNVTASELIWNFDDIMGIKEFPRYRTTLQSLHMMSMLLSEQCRGLSISDQNEKIRIVENAFIKGYINNAQWTRVTRRLLHEANQGILAARYNFVKSTQITQDFKLDNHPTDHPDTLVPEPPQVPSHPRNITVNPQMVTSGDAGGMYYKRRDPQPQPFPQWKPHNEYRRTTTMRTTQDDNASIESNISQRSHQSTVSKGSKLSKSSWSGNKNVRDYGTTKPFMLSPYGDGDDSSNMVYESHRNRYRSSRIKLRTRSQYKNDAPKWTGTLLEFPKFKNNIESFAYSAQISYMISRKFMDTYLRWDWERYTIQDFHRLYKDEDNFTLTERHLCAQQILEDRSALYAAILQAKEERAASEVTIKYQQQTYPDGIRCFAELIEKYLGEYNIRLEKIQQDMNTQYYRNYPGGMEAFLRLFEQAFTEYNQIKFDQARDEGLPYTPMTDQEKIQRVSAQLGYYLGTHSVIRSAETHSKLCQPYGFLAYTQQLRKEIQRAERTNQNNAIAQSNARVRRQQGNLNANINDTNPNNGEISHTDLFNLNMASNTLFPQYNLPKELYECIPKEARLEFTLKRKALQEQQNPEQKQVPEGTVLKTPDSHTTSNANEERTVSEIQEKPKPMPRQYGNRTANLTQLEEGQSDNEESKTMAFYTHLSTALTTRNNMEGIDCSEFESDSESSHEHFQHYMYKRYNDNASHEEAVQNNPQRVMNLSMKLPDGHMLACVDSGANAILASFDAWEATSFYPNRYAIIQGCKSNYTEKGNPIGSGLSVIVSDHIGVPNVYIQAHEITFHKDTTTLLSVLQMQQAGHIVDTTMTQFVANPITGEKGTQSMYINGDPNTRIPFSVHEGLLTLKLRKPTKEEIEQQEFINITAPSLSPWNPRLINSKSPHKADIQPDVSTAYTTSACPETLPMSPGSTNQNSGEIHDNASSPDFRGDPHHVNYNCNLDPKHVQMNSKHVQTDSKHVHTDPTHIQTEYPNQVQNDSNTVQNDANIGQNRSNNVQTDRNHVQSDCIFEYDSTRTDASLLYQWDTMHMETMDDQYNFVELHYQFEDIVNVNEKTEPDEIDILLSRLTEDEIYGMDQTHNSAVHAMYSLHAMKGSLWQDTGGNLMIPGVDYSVKTMKETEQKLKYLNKYIRSKEDEQEKQERLAKQRVELEKTIMDSNARRRAQRELEKRNNEPQDIPTKTNETDELIVNKVDEEADDTQPTQIDNEEADDIADDDKGVKTTDDKSTDTPITSNRSKNPRSNTEANQQELKKRKGIGTVEPEFELNDDAGTNVQYRSVRAKHKSDSPENYLRFFAGMPMQTVRWTLRNTTQLAKAIVNTPIIRHMQPRFPFMNRFRMNEKVSTDTIFASVKALNGYHCAQVFFGLTSKCIDVFPMKSKSQFPEILSDFLRNVGIPNVLRRDNAKEENSDAVKQQLRKMVIGDEFSEPGMQFQNSVEPGAIRWLKSYTERLLDTTGAPDFLWFEALSYLAKLHNCTAKESMKWQIPDTVRYGHTKDISHMLAFELYEPVYYLTASGFPKTQETLGRWLGPATNCGDCLTWRILAPNNQIIITSMARPANKLNKLNSRLPSDHQFPTSKQSVNHQPKRSIFKDATPHHNDNHDDRPLVEPRSDIKGGITKHIWILNQHPSQMQKYPT